MKNKLLSLNLVLLTITFIAGLILSSSSVSANSTANASVTVAATCTITTGGGNYSATIDPGTYEEITGNGINISCNDSGGYALYAIGYSGDSYTTPDNNRMLGPNSTYIPTATSGNDSYWAMKVAGSSTTSNIPTIANSFSSYQQIPATYTKVSYYPSATMGTTTNSVTTPTYKINIASTQTVGTYIGKVKYTMVHPNMSDDSNMPVTPLLATDCTAGYICYAPNADDIEGSMSSLGAISGAGKAKAGRKYVGTSASIANLIAPNYSREGYGFAGWSTDYEATSSSTIFGPNETITLASDGSGDANISTNGLILYPAWVTSTGTMQTFSCSSLNVGEVTARTDARDNNTYAIAKLADAKCWMIENLRIEALNTRGNTNQTLAQGYGDGTASGYGKFIGLADSENSHFTSSSTDANSIYYSGTQSGDATMDVGTGNYVAHRIPRYNNVNTNRSLDANYSSNGSTYRSWYGYGNYYNWPAAIADTSLQNATNQDVNDVSLCPSGWRLPASGGKTRMETGNNDFYALGIASGLSVPNNYTSSSLPSWINNSDQEGANASKVYRAYPNNFIYAGYFGTSSTYQRSSYGYYWARTLGPSNAHYNAGHLTLYVSEVDPCDSSAKWAGRSVRCIAGS